MALIWRTKPFFKLSLDDLYAILKLRSDVFIVEQRCIFSDIDEKDKKAIHLFATEKDNRVVAYVRLFDAGVHLKDYTSIGRLVVCPKERGKGYGVALIEKSKDYIREHFDNKKIKISAQRYLQKFYENNGFVYNNEDYLEDNIPHCAMYMNIV